MNNETLLRIISTRHMGLTAAELAIFSKDVSKLKSYGSYNATKTSDIRKK